VGRHRETIPYDTVPLDEFSQGYMLGLLAGEGHFGGDGRQPQITLRMHERHERIFLWLKGLFPGSGLYGPYHHGGRDYYQWMARGPVLRDQIWPLLMARIEYLDDHVRERVLQMGRRYRLPLPTETEGSSSDLNR
jgi:hypothetical protein